MKTSQNVLIRVEEALQAIRPYLEKDGGNVRVVRVEKGKLILKFEGNCSSCNMSNMTLKAGIEEAVRNHVPEIKSVEAE